MSLDVVYDTKEDRKEGLNFNGIFDLIFIVGPFCNMYSLDLLRAGQGRISSCEVPSTSANQTCHHVDLASLDAQTAVPDVEDPGSF